MRRRGLVEFKVAAGVVVRDILDHAREDLHVGRQQTALDIVGEQVAEDATELLVARIREERTAVGKHTYETTQQTKY